MEEGIFIRRINRFVVECKINEEKIKAYLPNSGKLIELLLPKRKIYLKKSDGKFNYRVFGVEKNGKFVCLDTHFTNKIVEGFLKEGIIEEFKGYEIKDKEIRIGKRRIDFLLQKGSKKVPLEVKSCTLFYDNISMFPDARTERGKEHLEIISKNKGAIIFVVFNDSAEYFLPDFHTDPLFSKTLYDLREKIFLKAISVKYENNNFKFVRNLKIPWYVYEREGKDKGVYIISGRLGEDKIIKIGSLGDLYFKSGYYLYVGSSMNSLSSRIKRHLKKEKKLRWHIDYLIPHLEEIKVFPIRTSEKIECFLSSEIENIVDGYIENFGSSDCKCKSHLYFFKGNIIEKEKFIEILLRFRIGRLKNLLTEKIF